MGWGGGRGRWDESSVHEVLPSLPLALAHGAQQEQSSHDLNCLSDMAAYEEQLLAKLSDEVRLARKDYDAKNAVRAGRREP